MHRILKLLILVALVNACTQPSDRTRVVRQLNSQKDVSTPFPDPGVTYASFDAGHGYQIEYLAPDGSAHLWYPGNRVAVMGEWKTLLDEVCYRYDSSTYNPQTGRRGGHWNCAFKADLERHIVAYLAGDAFQLASGRIPYVRARCEVPSSFNLLKKAKCK